MNCVICKHGLLADGHTTLTLERAGLVVVYKDVPARVCDNCGEAYLDETVSRDVLAAAEKAAQSGVEVDIRHYVAA